MEIAGGLNADGSPAAYDFATRYPSNAATTLALLLPLAACTTAPAPSASVATPVAAAAPPKLLLISIDGLRVIGYQKPERFLQTLAALR